MGLAQVVVDPFTLFPGPGGPVAGDAAQDFDGTDDYFSATGWYPGSSEDGIASFWIRRDATGVTHVIHANGNTTYWFGINSANKVGFLLRNSSLVTLLEMNSGATTITDTNWHHVLASWELDSTPRSWFYLDDVDVKTATTEAQGFVAWPHTTNHIGGNGLVTPGDLLDGCLSEFYVQVGEFLDLSVTANRRLFIDASAKPVELGSDGSTPTGVQPEVYIPGDDFTDNKGTNANLTASGSPAACSNNPG
ncbi:MAG: hypothetical protein IID08_11090 [Candidatus Hydrogenedentes bacterium]|nr:hypothetical protein [Candidatus Hydrogenedentota bacterium]